MPSIASTAGSHRQELRCRLLTLFSKQMAAMGTESAKIHTVDIALTSEQNEASGRIKKKCIASKSALAQKKEVKHRIVSIDRPYIRPIVRR